MKTIQTTSKTYNSLKIKYLNGLSKKELYKSLEYLRKRNGWYVTENENGTVTYGRHDDCNCTYDGYAPCFSPEDKLGETIGRLVEVTVNRNTLILFASDFEDTLTLRFVLPSIKKYRLEDKPKKKVKKKTSDKNHYRR